jgi:large subunit ribosomal protein L7Ae
MVSKESIEKAFEAVEIARNTGKIKKGANEVTKVIERGQAKLVLVAENTNPQEIVMHLEPLCKEKTVPFVKVTTKEELGTAAGLSVGTTAVAIVNEGEAKEAIKAVIRLIQDGK